MAIKCCFKPTLEDLSLVEPTIYTDFLTVLETGLYLEG